MIFEKANGNEVNWELAPNMPFSYSLKPGDTDTETLFTAITAIEMNIIKLDKTARYSATTNIATNLLTFSYSAGTIAALTDEKYNYEIFLTTNTRFRFQFGTITFGENIS